MASMQRLHWRPPRPPLRPTGPGASTATTSLGLVVCANALRASLPATTHRRGTPLVSRASSAFHTSPARSQYASPGTNVSYGMHHSLRLRCDRPTAVQKAPLAAPATKPELLTIELRLDGSVESFLAPIMNTAKYRRLLDRRRTLTRAHSAYSIRSEPRHSAPKTRRVGACTRFTRSGRCVLHAARCAVPGQRRALHEG